jgi:arylsulfatase A-like enzyme|tara:strand:+ start:940 stop:2430 length:1491 start_codon:yes stop_codon:yes gene_type:complete
VNANASRSLACLLALSVTFCLHLASHAAEPPHRPNVLFIAVDDLNDWVNCMGGRKGVHTPNFDRLATRGALFTNAHCAAPACNPSRVSVMTGVAPSSSGVYNNGQDWRRSPRLTKAVTLPEHFRASGYLAIGGGKIFHALSWIRDGYGKQQNEAKLWDAYWPSATNPMPDPQWPKGTEAKRASNGYLYSKPLAIGKNAKGRPPHFFDWGPDQHAESGTADHKVVDWAAGELAKKRKQPFFHGVGIFRPHIPWYAPAKYFDLYPEKDVFLPKVKEDDLADVPPRGHASIRKQWHRWLVENDEWRGAVRGYLASISYSDAQVGRLLDALDAGPHANDTIVVLWSDHGMHIGEKQQWEKFTLFEESTRVPFIIVAPGVSKRGSVCDRPVNLLDIYPTLNELCHLPKRDDLDGVSLVPLLRDPHAKWDRPAITTWGKGNHAARGQRYRYVLHPNGDDQLYDHQVDPDEFTNLADKSELDAVKKRLREWFPETDAKPVPYK